MAVGELAIISILGLSSTRVRGKEDKDVEDSRVLARKTSATAAQHVSE